MSYYGNVRAKMDREGWDERDYHNFLLTMINYMTSASEPNGVRLMEMKLPSFDEAYLNVMLGIDKRLVNGWEHPGYVSPIYVAANARANNKIDTNTLRETITHLVELGFDINWKFNLRENRDYCRYGSLWDGLSSHNDICRGWKHYEDIVLIDGETALHVVARNSVLDCVPVLVSLGANPHTPDANKRTAASIIEDMRGVPGFVLKEDYLGAVCAVRGVPKQDEAPVVRTASA